MTLTDKFECWKVACPVTAFSRAFQRELQAPVACNDSREV